MERKKGIRTAADSVQSEWPLWHAAKSNLRAQAQLTKTRTETFELVKVEPKLWREKQQRERERCASRRYLLHIIV
ncbi:hypothetical protein TNCV_2145671 [Trichonephila clavipes]|uniref:Uncharacterized protein n=1 Tax=Trichonephila clavipes TaxID=2585209 RepID=A0A8X6STT0_TRICX|nr:hypothetical protein TNCV_2145671 [Trichonephila clavipes]